jgi:hypothetical protein
MGWVSGQEKRSTPLSCFRPAATKAGVSLTYAGRRSPGEAPGRQLPPCRNGFGFPLRLRPTRRQTNAQGVECDHPDRVVKLAGQEIGDDRFEIRPLDLGLAVYAATGKAVDHKIRGLVRPVRYDPRYPVRLTHYANSRRNKNPAGLKLSLAEWFHAVERLDQYLEAEAQAGL